MVDKPIKFIAIIPIKHHSSRVPQKNYRILGDKPLYQHMLDTLVNSKLFDTIIVDTNSPIIREGCQIYYANKIVVLDRPQYLCDDNTSTNKLIHHILATYTYDPECTIFFQTHVTNPFLEISTIKETMDIFINNYRLGLNDSLFSTNRHQVRLYAADGKPINHIASELIPTQELSPLYEENSCIYLFTGDSFNKKQHRIGLTPYMYIIKSRIESLDIDWEEDFQIAEAIYNNKNKNKSIKDRYVVITGAAGGIGLATAKYFKEKGWQVIGIDINMINEEEMKSIFRLFIVHDITDKNITKILEEYFEKSGIMEIHSWINISAIQQCKPIIETTDDDWDKIMDCNLKSIFILSKFAVPYLKRVNGSIVNIASVHSIQSSNNIATYATSKAALAGLTRNMAIEFAQMGIRVNALSPGAIDTNMLRSGLVRNIESPTEEMIKESLDRLGKKHLCSRVGKPIEIASSIYFLADNELSSFIYGANLMVDGGATIKLATE